MSEIQKRILTSIVLLIILYLSLLNKMLLSILLLFITFLMFLEIYNILKKIFVLKKAVNFIVLFFAFIYIAFFSAFIWIFLVFEKPNNQMLFLLTLSICISTDIGGYVFGKIFKGKKLTSVSPNKTYSGMFGSYFLSFLTVIVFFNEYMQGFSFLLVVFITSTLSQLGDLFISYLKRKANLKDTGTFLPGHGGILDRLDGMLIALPFGLILLT